MLALLGARHDRLTGHAPQVAAHAPWLRSVRGERALYPGEAAHVTMLERILERILILMVVLAVLAFEIWFLFYSGSPFDQRSGR